MHEVVCMIAIVDTVTAVFYLRSLYTVTIPYKSQAHRGPGNLQSGICLVGTAAWTICLTEPSHLLCWKAPTQIAHLLVQGVLFLCTKALTATRL